MHAPVLYFDLASPYAYLAVARAEAVLGPEVELVPILLGALFARRGQGSWAHTEQREAGMAEVQARAARYGLPALTWPPGWPANSLAANRAATWAREHGAAGAFARALYHRQFAHGADIADVAVVRAAAGDARLDAGAMLEAIASPEIKAALREATDDAWERGVSGVPTTRIGDALFFGDDRLADAAAQLG